MHEYRDVRYIREEEHGGLNCRLCDERISSKEDRVKMLEKHVHSFRHELRYLQLEQGQKIYVAYERVRRTDELETLLERINNLNSASFKMAFE